MKQCRYCRLSTNNLVAVIVTSRGKPIKSTAHLECIPLWRNISDVKIDPSAVAEEEFKMIQLDLQVAEEEMAAYGR